MSASSLEIQLLGKRISLKTGADPELAREVIELASERIQAAEKRSKDQTPQNVLLLALLDLAEAHVRAKRRVAAHQQQIDEKSQQLLLFLSPEEK